MRYELRAIACQTCGHPVESHAESGCAHTLVMIGTHRCRCAYSAVDLRARFHIEPRFCAVATAAEPA